MRAALLALWAVVAAPAQEPGASAPPSDEITVYGQRRIDEAKRAIEDQAAAAGYDEVIHKGNETILRHSMPWKGELVLRTDGHSELRRQPVQFEPPFAKKSPLAWASCIVVPLCVKPLGQTVSKRRFRAYEREVMAEVAPKIMEWNARIADAAIEGKIEALPDRLERLWELGEPLDAGDRLNTPASRRAAIFAFWDSRTENTWGLEVRASVAAFARAVVQSSDHPFTAAELAAFDAQRRSLMRFPVDPVAPAALDAR